MTGNLGNPGNPTDLGTPTSTREGVVIPAGAVVYDSTLDRYFLGDGVTLGGNEILGARYDTADRSITFDKLSQGAIDYIDASGGASDHGGLTGLGDDDHTQYLLADGTRGMSGALNIEVDGTGDALLIEGTDDSGDAAPVITLKRHSASPANNDYIGQLKFKGENDADQEKVYAKVTAKIDVATAGSEDGILEFMNRNNGSEQIALRLKQDSFRTLNGVELHVDGNTGLGTNSPSQKLDVVGNIAVTGTVDGRDVGADGIKLDGIEAGAKDDQSADEVPFSSADWAAAGASYNAADVREALEQLLANKAETGTNMGSANQTLTANRIIDDGDNGYFFFIDLLKSGSGGKSVQFLLNPATPSATWKAQYAVGTAVTLLNTGNQLNMIFQGTSDLAINSSAGTAGQVLTSNGSGVSPGWSTPEYMVPIWAEENAPLGNTTYEWAFGNGANAGAGQGVTVYVPSGWNCEVVAMSLTLAAGNATVELDLSGTLQGSAANVSVTGGGAGTNTLSSPIAVVTGDRINFRTTSASGTTATNVVTAWLRYYK